MSGTTDEQDAILDEVVLKRLRELRALVERPGENLLGDLLVLFERDSKARLEALRAASSPTARKNAAHALKGSAANLGARTVAALALAIERAPEQPADVDALAAAVEQAMVALRARLG
ncbi:MAG: Hpt domain-containing protein [Deltaproteobacteria bacterium]|nr:Hpt domain-containing protein [Deltaproteobacteria bacterium]